MMSPTESRGVPSDRGLIERCLKHDESAWGALIDRYKNYVYSVILRYGISTENAPDVFQLVWLDVLKGLESVRRRDSVRSWLASVTVNVCYRWTQRQKRDDAATSVGDPPEVATLPTWVEELEQEQIVRQCLEQLSQRCTTLVRMLFFEEPPRPYDEVARELGLATGSIGFMRARCLKKLESLLRATGLT